MQGMGLTVKNVNRSQTKRKHIWQSSHAPHTHRVRVGASWMCVQIKSNSRRKRHKHKRKNKRDKEGTRTIITKKLGLWWRTSAVQIMRHGDTHEEAKRHRYRYSERSRSKERDKYEYAYEDEDETDKDTLLKKVSSCKLPRLGTPNEHVQRQRWRQM